MSSGSCSGSPGNEAAGAWCSGRGDPDAVGSRRWRRGGRPATRCATGAADSRGVPRPCAAGCAWCARATEGAPRWRRDSRAGRRPPGSPAAGRPRRCPAPASPVPWRRSGARGGSRRRGVSRETSLWVSTGGACSGPHASRTRSTSRACSKASPKPVSPGRGSLTEACTSAASSASRNRDVMAGVHGAGYPHTAVWLRSSGWTRTWRTLVAARMPITSWVAAPSATAGSRTATWWAVRSWSRVIRSEGASEVRSPRRRSRTSPWRT